MVHGRGWLAVHAGVHPRRPRKTRRRHALHLRCWKGKPWFEQYRGRKLVVHGHWAGQGLVDRRPYSIGLDTGCVRGGRLTGYLLEKERFVSVRARRSYM